MGTTIQKETRYSESVRFLGEFGCILLPLVLVVGFLIFRYHDYFSNRFARKIDKEFEHQIADHIRHLDANVLTLKLDDSIEDQKPKALRPGEKYLVYYWNKTEHRDAIDLKKHETIDVYRLNGFVWDKRDMPEYKREIEEIHLSDYAKRDPDEFGSIRYLVVARLYVENYVPGKNQYYVVKRIGGGVAQGPYVGSTTGGSADTGLDVWIKDLVENRFVSRRRFDDPYDLHKFMMNLGSSE